jgi:hypothetical protein
MLNERIATVASAIALNTGAAERAFAREAPTDPESQPAYQRLMDLGETALALVTAEAALRASFTGELERISNTDCDNGNACRIDALAAAGGSYTEESLGLATVWLRKYREI